MVVACPEIKPRKYVREKPTRAVNSITMAMPVYNLRSGAAGETIERGEAAVTMAANDITTVRRSAAVPHCLSSVQLESQHSARARAFRHHRRRARLLQGAKYAARSAWLQNREWIGRTKRHSARWTKKQSSSLILSSAGRGFPWDWKHVHKEPLRRVHECVFGCSSFGE